MNVHMNYLHVKLIRLSTANIKNDYENYIHFRDVNPDIDTNIEQHTYK